MVDDNLKKRHPVWQGMRPLSKTRPTNGAGPNAPSFGTTIRTIPEMGTRFCRTIQTTGDEDRKPIHYRGHRLLHEMGGSKNTTSNMATSTTKNLYEFIWCRYGCPIELISDQGGHFLGQVVESLTTFYAVFHKRSTPY